MKIEVTSEDFQKYCWMTPYQIRDYLIEFVYFINGGLTSEIVSHIRNLGTEEQTRRKKLNVEFVECPFCKGYHNKLNNTDELCELHLHIVNFDRNYAQKFGIKLGQKSG
jgi:hypothetical protein